MYRLWYNIYVKIKVLKKWEGERVLKFVLGTAGSGKTYNLISKMDKLAESGDKDILFLVPEQASFECEKELLKI